MNFILVMLTNFGSFESSQSMIKKLQSGVKILKISATVFFVCSFLIACSGYPADLAFHAASLNSAENSALVTAANAEIAESNATGAQDTQCSDFVAKVIRRTGLNVPGFHANDFNKIAATYLPQWKLTEFTTADLPAGRAALKAFLNSTPDHTAFLAQWPRLNQSGHVAIVEKVAEDQFVIYQAQGGLSLPHSAPVKVESLLYGIEPVDRSHLRLWVE